MNNHAKLIALSLLLLLVVGIASQPQPTHALAFDNFADYSYYRRAVTVYGTATGNTIAYKFGGASGQFLDDSSYLSIAPASEFTSMGSSWTIETWFYPETWPMTGNSINLVTGDDGYGNNNGRLYIANNAGGTIYWLPGAGTGYSGSCSLNADIHTSITGQTFNHIELVDNAGALMLFVNGLQQKDFAAGCTGFTWGTNANMKTIIMSRSGYAAGIEYLLDEYRISNIARNTGDFSLPALEYVPDTNTLLLMHMDLAQGYERVTTTSTQSTTVVDSTSSSTSTQSSSTSTITSSETSRTLTTVVPISVTSTSWTTSTVAGSVVGTTTNIWTRTLTTSTSISSLSQDTSSSQSAETVTSTTSIESSTIGTSTATSYTTSTTTAGGTVTELVHETDTVHAYLSLIYDELRTLVNHVSEVLTDVFQQTNAPQGVQVNEVVVTTVTGAPTTSVTVKLLSSTNNGLSGGVVQYYSSGWHPFGTTGTDGTASMALQPGTYTFQISYGGGIEQKSQNIANNPVVVFQTTLVTMSLVSSTNTQLSGGAQYYASGWHAFGGGTTTTTMELLPLTYTFRVNYGGGIQQLSQNVATNPNVVFQTTLVTMRLLSSANAELSGGAQYYASGWHTFGGGTTTTTMEMLPVTYTFQISYVGGIQQLSQNVASNPNVVFRTTLVTMSLVSSTNTQLSGGAQYYASGWHAFGGGTTTTSMELLPLTYTFQITYAGASQQKSQNVATNPNVAFQTTLVTMSLVSSSNAQLSGGAQYYASGWHTFGGGTTTTTMELLPVTYTFQVSWAGGSQQKSQNVATNPSVVFQTVQVHSDSSQCTSYYASGWRTFTQDMELLPGSYTFRFGDGTRDTSYTIVAGAVNHIH